MYWWFIVAYGEIESQRGDSEGSYAAKVICEVRDIACQHDTARNHMHACQFDSYREL